MSKYNEISINVRYTFQNKEDNSKNATVHIQATDEKALFNCLCSAIKACPDNFLGELMSRALLQTSLTDN